MELHQTFTYWNPCFWIFSSDKAAGWRLPERRGASSPSFPPARHCEFKLTHSRVEPLLDRLHEDCYLPRPAGGSGWRIHAETKHDGSAELMGVKQTGKGRRKIGSNKRKNRAKIRHRK